jgi:hypothetical protein
MGQWVNNWEDSESFFSTSDDVEKSFSGPVTISITKHYNSEGKDKGQIRVSYTIPEVLPKQDSARKSILEVVDELKQIKLDYLSYEKGLENMVEQDLPRLTTTIVDPILNDLIVLSSNLPSVSGAAYVNGVKVSSKTYAAERSRLKSAADRIHVLANEFNNSPISPNLDKKLKEKSADRSQARKYLEDQRLELKNAVEVRNIGIGIGIGTLASTIGFGIACLIKTRNRRNYF